MSDLESQTLESALQTIRDRAKDVDNARVYMCLRAMHVKPIRVSTVEDVKLLIALNELNLQITTRLWYAVKGDCHSFDHNKNNNACIALHTLGDKKVLVLKRGESSNYKYRHSWIVSDIFKQYYYGGTQTE